MRESNQSDVVSIKDIIKNFNNEEANLSKLLAHGLGLVYSRRY